MTTINKIIEQVEEIKPNVFGEEVKFGWLSQLNGMICRIVMQQEETPELKYPDDMDKDLLVPEPYEGLYALWLMAKIDFYNRDDDDYNNTMLMFNQMFDEYKKLYIRENMPRQAGGYKNVMMG